MRTVSALLEHGFLCQVLLILANAVADFAGMCDARDPCYTATAATAGFVCPPTAAQAFGPRRESLLVWE
jgi:hypothetical protein